MKIDSIITEHFSEQHRAQNYVSNRLLANYKLAPPAIPPEGSGLQLEPYRTDVLIDVALSIEDKNILWSACLAAFEKWRDWNAADDASATAMYHLVYMIAELSERGELPEEFKISFQNIIDAGKLKPSLPASAAAISMYDSLITLVDLWQLWDRKRWEQLFGDLLKNGSADSERQCSLMLKTSRNIDWGADKTKKFINWAANARNCPEDLLRQYCASRLLAGGVNNKVNSEYLATPEQVSFRRDFVKQLFDALVSPPLPLINLDEPTIKKWGITVKDIMNFFKTNSLNLERSEQNILRKRAQSLAICALIAIHQNKQFPI